MDAALIGSAALLGLAGMPHCVAMCGAPCAAAVGGAGWPSSSAFQGARVASYAVGGALAATSVSALAGWSQWSPALRPLWVLLHAAALSLGLWLLITARQPAWLARIGRVAGPSAQPVGWSRVRGPLGAAGRGGLWVAWPCGLLQSALVVSALASGAVGGATVMAAFAIASAPGLVAGPWVWRRLIGSVSASGRRLERLAIRAAGGLLAVASSWSLGQVLWGRIVALCAGS